MALSALLTEELPMGRLFWSVQFISGSIPDSIGDLVNLQYL
jgi:hypothetical protein